MTRFARLTALTALAGTALSAAAVAQSPADDARFDAAQRRFQNELRLFQDEFARYQQARANPPRYDNRYPDNRYYQDDRDEGGYDPSRYYRDGGNYQERVLTADDRVYRGSDGRYYCKRNDGTTGLIIGAVGGGILGNVIQGGHSRTVGTLLGGGIGALLGKSIDQNSSQVRCR